MGKDDDDLFEMMEKRRQKEKEARDKIIHEQLLFDAVKESLEDGAAKADKDFEDGIADMFGMDYATLSDAVNHIAMQSGDEELLKAGREFFNAKNKKNNKKALKIANAHRKAFQKAAQEHKSKQGCLSVLVLAMSIPIAIIYGIAEVLA